MQKMLKLFRAQITFLCLLSLLTGTSWAEELTVKIAFTFKEYYRWEGDAKETLRHVTIREWSPYDLHPNLLDVNITIANQSKTELTHLKAVTRVIPRVGILSEDKQFGFDIDRLHKTASWSSVYLTDESTIDSLGPGKTAVKRLNNFDLKRLLDTLFKEGKWATGLKVETIVESRNAPIVRVKKAEVLRIIPPTE